APAQPHLSPCSPAELRKLRNKQRDDYAMSRILVRDKALGIKHLANQKRSEHGVGGNLWGAALVLCRFLASSSRPPGRYLNGKRILELGSGTGAVGLAAASLGADVTLTDLPQVLPLTASNMAANSLCSPGTSLALLDWKVVANWPKDALPNYDLILCSDVLYWSDVVPDLAAVLGRLLQNGKTTLLWCWVRSFPSYVNGTQGLPRSKVQKVRGLQVLVDSLQHQAMKQTCVLSAGISGAAQTSMWNILRTEGHEHVARELWRALAAQGIVVGRLPLESGLLQSEDFCHVSRHVEAFVGCARGGQLDQDVAKDAMCNFVVDADGCVKGVYSHACPSR
ncbi:unnamed protein product, partial [Symbiodinium sp. CCMP2592]